MKLLLQVRSKTLAQVTERADMTQIASSISKAFQELLDVYASIGESVPFMARYESLFRKDSNMLRVLSITWKDILEFHRQALRYFQQPSKCSGSSHYLLSWSY